MRVDSMIKAVQINSDVLNGITLNDLISKLSPGDTVRAKVLDFIANEVLLKLFDNITVKAFIPDDFEGEIGKYSNFVVKESLPDKLVLEEQKSVKPNIPATDADILKALTKIGVQHTDENIELAKAIVENKLPLTKEAFDNTLKLIKAHTDIDIPKAVIMEANKLEANTVTLRQLGLLEKGSVSLGKELVELISMLDEGDQIKPQEQGQTTGGKTNTPNVSEAARKVNDTMSGNEHNIQITADKAVREDSQTAGKLNSAIIKDNGQDEEKTVRQAGASEDSEFDSRSFLKLVRESLKDDNSDKETIGKAADNSPKGSEADKAATDSSKKIALDLKKEVEKLFIKIEDLQDGQKADLEKNIKSMGEKLQNLKTELGSSNIANKEALIQKADNILNQLRFIDDIRSFGYYVPIPMKLNGTLGQADLFVLKRHRNKKINPDDATVFLALDTLNMGRIETLLCFNKKTINLNMRVEDKKYEEYIRTRFIDLYNLLSNMGYKLTDIKYRQINEPVNIFNVNKVTSDIMSSQSGGLDIRL